MTRPPRGVQQSRAVVRFLTADHRPPHSPASPLACLMEERVASIGRRSAHERLAHILLELYLRLELVGEANADAFTLPLTQEHLADLLGLTSIHVNRVLRRLKKEGLVATEARTIRLLSRERLMQIADFDPRYLMHRI